jgi:dethiobiotin synthetase
VAASARPADAWRITEGAGGLYSPLCEDGLNADLAEALGDPVLLVAEDRLGTLSGCLLALEALDRRGLEVLAVVLNRRRTTAHPAMDNAAELIRRSGLPVLSVEEGIPTADLDQMLSASSSSMVSPPEPGSTG